MFKRSALLVAMIASPLIATAGGIPDVRVGPFSFENESVQSALSRVVSGTGVSVVMVDAIPGALTAKNVSGKLDVVVAKMCGRSAVNCEFGGGVLRVSSLNKPEAAPSVPAVSAVRPAPIPTMPASMAIPGEEAAVAEAALHREMAAPSPAPTLVSAPTPAIDILIRVGEGLRMALSREVGKMGLKLSWSLREDRIASRDMVFSGASRDAVLNDILVAFRLPGYLVGGTNTLYIVKDEI